MSVKKPAQTPPPAAKVEEDDSATDVSDGDSIDGDVAHEEQVLSRVHRPSTLSDRSAYNVVMPDKYKQSPLSEKTMAPVVVDFAAHAKREAKAELLRATAPAPAEARPRERKEVPDDVKRAWGRPTSAAKVPEIDFSTLTRSNPVASTYDASSWGGVQAKIGSAQLSVSRYDDPNFTAPDLQHRMDEKNAAAERKKQQRRKLQQSAAMGDAADDSAPAVDPKLLKEAQQASALASEIKKTIAEIDTADDPERKDFLRMMLLLQNETAGERSAKQQQLLTQPAKTPPPPVPAAAPRAHRGATFDVTAASVLAMTDHAAEAKKSIDGTRQFYVAVATLEELCTSDEVDSLVEHCLERSRVQFLRNRAARERGEYSHEDHAAYKQFASTLEDFLFTRVARVVGPSFDLEEFFERVFEEEGQDDGTTATGRDASSYPLLSNEVWELLLAIMNFESYCDLMDSHIFAKNALTERDTSTGQTPLQTNTVVAAARVSPRGGSAETAIRPPLGAAGDLTRKALPSSTLGPVRGVPAPPKSVVKTAPKRAF